MPLNRIPRTPFVPKGCHQQDRIPATFETTELHDPDLAPLAKDDYWTNLGHRLLEWTCWLSAAAMIVAAIKGWIPPHG